jgi:hypothetical protein
VSIATDIVAQIDTAILAKATGGFVQNYTLPDGTNVQTSTLKELRDIRDFYKSLSAQESGGGFVSLAVLRPRS